MSVTSPDREDLFDMTDIGQALPESDASTDSLLVDSQTRLLLDYIRALPDGVKLSVDRSKVQYPNSRNKKNDHKIPVNELHNLIVTAVKSDPSHKDFRILPNKIIKDNIWLMLTCNLKQIPNLSKYLSFEKDELEVTVEVSESLTQLLHGAVDEAYNPQKDKGYIKIKIFSYKVDSSQVNQLSAAPPDSEIIPFSCKVTDVQALLALAITLKCYPNEWRQYLFWDAWLAVTIQLGLLETVDSNNPNNEVFPCQWIKQVFYAERLVKNPDRVYCVIMGQDPDCNEDDENSLSELRASTGVAFHKIEDLSIKGITNQYGLDCTDDWPKNYCKDGILLVNMIRCIPLNSQSMTKNCFYDAWFTYTLKISEYFGKTDIPVLVMCDNSLSPNLVKYILTVNSKAKKVQHPANISNSADIEKDRDTFYKIVFNHDSPIFWDTLTDYICALPDDVVNEHLDDDNDDDDDDDNDDDDDDDDDDNDNDDDNNDDNDDDNDDDDDDKTLAEISSVHCDLLRRIPVNILHNLIFNAVNYEHTSQHITDFLEYILCNHRKTACKKEKICELSNHLSTDSIEVNIVPSLTKLLEAAVDKKYEQQDQNKHNITIKGIDRQPISISVTDVQAIISLVVVFKCYPTEWRKLFFWDAWLAVTIQLSLLKYITNSDDEIFPCLWMKQVFLAERLLKRPANVESIIMAQDPVSGYVSPRVKRYNNTKIPLKSLRSATGIAFHGIGNKNASVRGMNSKYKLNCYNDEPINYCKHGLLLVNMVRCIHRNDTSMDGNDFQKAWFLYTLRLSSYFGKISKCVVLMYNKNYPTRPKLVQSIQAVYPGAKGVLHPGRRNEKPSDEEKKIVAKAIKFLE